MPMLGHAWSERTRREGFSLTELLVVLLILTVLMALGIPLLKSVGIASRKTKCIAHLRQLSLFIAAYAGDYKGEIPVDRTNDASGNTWYMPLQRYAYPSNWQKNPGYNDKRSPFFCPAHQAQTGWTNYSANGNLYFDNMTAANGTAEEKQAFRNGRTAVRSTQNLHPDTAILLDSSGQNPMTTWFITYGARYSKTWTSTYALHGDSINVLFINGNVRNVRISPRNVNALGDLNELKAEWFWPLRFN